MEMKKKDSLYIDGLQKILPFRKDTARINCLNNIAEGFLNRDGYKIKTEADSAYPYAIMSNTEAKRINYKRGIAYSLMHLSQIVFLNVIHNNNMSIKNNAEIDNSALFSKWDEYLNQLFLLAQELNDNEIWGLAYYHQSDMYGKKKNPTSGIDALKKSLFYSQKAGNEVMQSELNTWLCMIYIDRGEYEKGFDYCKRSLELAKKLIPTSEINSFNDYLVQQALMNMSELYTAAGDYQTALDYLRQSEQFRLSRKSSMNWSVEGEMAELFKKMGQYDSVLIYEKPMNSNGPINMWKANNLGATYLMKADYDSAILMFNKAITGFRKNKNANSKALKISLTGAAKAYIGKKDYKSALPLVKESLAMAQHDSDRLVIRDNYEILSELFYHTGKTDSAYSYLKKYTLIKDSILNQQFYWRLNTYKKEAEEQKKTSLIQLLQKDNVIKGQLLQEEMLRKKQNEAELALLEQNSKIKDQELLIKEQNLKEQTLLKEQNVSQVGLLDKENKLKDQRLRQQATIRNALLAGLLLFLALGFFIFRSLSLKRKNERLRNEKQQAELQQKAAELEMQALRAQMNPHFIFNCLSSINKFILKNDTDEASDYLTRFSRLIRQVLTNSQLSSIPLSDEIEMLRLYLDMERLRFSESFTYNIIYENTIEPETIYIPPMLLQPFCENAIWHGLMHLPAGSHGKEGEGKLDVIMSIQNGELQCVISDNGIGREKAAELKSKSGAKQKSFGLKITTERLALFNNEKKAENFYQTDDIVDEKGKIAGTKVILKIRLKTAIEQPV